MALTVEDIQEKTFGTRFRGYNAEEVDVFLEDIMEEFDRFNEQIEQSKQQTKELQDRLNYFDEMKESLSQSVLVAQETADRVRKQAEEEAAQTLVAAKDEAARLLKQAQDDSQRIVADAQNEAQTLLDKASSNAQDLLSETEDLRKQSQNFQERMVSALQEQLRLAQSSEWEELLHPVNPNSALAQVLEQPKEEAVTSATNEVPAVETPLEETQEQEFVFTAPEVDPESIVPEVAVSETYDDQEIVDATRQFTEEEMMDLQRRIDESNRILEETQNLQADIEEAQRILEEQGLLEEETTSESFQAQAASETETGDNLNETKTFKLF